jgi:hypothetical protein
MLRLVRWCIQRFVGKPEWKTPLRISRTRLKYNIKVDFKDVGCENVDWIHLAQGV